MRVIPSLAAVALLGLGLGTARADVVVVAHAGVNLTGDEVREVFLGDKQFAGSVKLVPIENASLQSEFQSKVLKVDANRYASIWSKKGFREGLTPPPVRASDQDVLAAVKSNPGTVGYVSKATPDVKVIQKY
jgi:ABC-type phosphate transport system substrate-binding protein